MLKKRNYIRNERLFLYATSISKSGIYALRKVKAVRPCVDGKAKVVSLNPNSCCAIAVIFKKTGKPVRGTDVCFVILYDACTQHFLLLDTLKYLMRYARCEHKNAGMTHAKCALSLSDFSQKRNMSIKFSKPSQYTAHIMKIHSVVAKN